jgi:hypothetical protein
LNALLDLCEEDETFERRRAAEGCGSKADGYAGSIGSLTYTRLRMLRKPPRATFDTSSRSVVIEPLEPPVGPTPLEVAPVSDDHGAAGDDDPGSPV